MRLYRTADGEWIGTQADARSAAEGRGWEQVEVPTDKAGLLGFLNDMEAKNPRREASSILQAPEEAEAVKQSNRDLQRSIDIDEEIAAADFPTTIRLAEHIHGRLEEHRQLIVHQARERRA
ncbi:MAG: hypothetical protein AAFW97_13075 [Pseudomonadota bacterium]